MKVNGINLEATPEQIIDILREELSNQQGRYILRRTKSLANNYQFSCPFHSEGLENHPSCGMTREVGYSRGKVIDPGTVHCFTCGYTSPLPKFIADVLGNVRGELFGMQWLKQHFLSSSEVLRPEINLFATSKRSAKKKFITEDELVKYRWNHPYMYERGLDDNLIELFDVGYDKLSNCLTFPVKNIDGDIVFIYRRSVFKKFHNYGEDDDKTNYLYGAYELLQYQNDFDEDLRNRVYVVESILNCLTLWKYGFPAVSTMGVGGGNQYELLKKLPQRQLVLALDPDKAGINGQNKIRQKLKSTKIVSELSYPDYFYTDKLDINSNPDELNFDNIIL